ncbi:hypothetical protein BaRGS_00017198 [Batillaria attramentaria]|uniref:Organic cation transporter protein n=1 Tax=Batillaria attramentaria TaxID=370345 RepID=A0ABD0KXA8_9CAEN
MSKKEDVAMTSVNGIPGDTCVENKRKVLKFDEVLKEVGEFGLYQKRLLFLVCLTGGCVIMQNLSPVITMKSPKHRCKIPGYANDTYEIQSPAHEFLVNMTIPVSSDGSYEQCDMYDVTYLDGDLLLSNTSKSKTVGCAEWVYDRSAFTETLVSELDLVCEKKIYRSHSSMMIFAGKFVGAFLNSVGGDYFGRRRVYTFMMLAMVASAVGLVFVSSLPALMALRFFAGGTTTGSYLCTYVIGMELMGLSQRRWTSLAYKISEISLALLAVLFAYLLRDWHHFQASLAAPFIPESPRWLMSKGRMAEAQKVMDDVARVNGVAMAPRLEADSSEVILTKQQSEQDKKAVVSPVQLFRIPRLLVRYTLLYFSWIFIIMCMYGLMLNVSNMSGDIFLNFALMSAVDILAVVIYVLLIERVGRRPLLVGVTALGGLACLATILPTIFGGSSWVLRGLSIAGRMCITAALTTIYVMSPELFPTVLRSFGLGSCSMLARIGGLASPYVADLNTYVSGVWGPALPQVVFGIAGVTTAGMVLVLPETRGRHLPETVRDAEMFGRVYVDKVLETNVPKPEKA